METCQAIDEIHDCQQNIYNAYNTICICAFTPLSAVAHWWHLDSLYLYPEFFGDSKHGCVEHGVGADVGGTDLSWGWWASPNQEAKMPSDGNCWYLGFPNCQVLPLHRHSDDLY